MINGLYSISMPLTELLDYEGIDERIVSEVPVEVRDWEGLRRVVREGDEIMLVGSVPEQEAVIQLHAVVTEFRDDIQTVMVVV